MFDDGQEHLTLTCLARTNLKISESQSRYRVRNLKLARNLKFTTYKTLVNFMKEMIFCLKTGIFQFKKP